MKSNLCAVICIFLGLSSAVSTAQTEDYVSVELRSRIEALKADVAAAPTNDSNVRERARIMWDWVNAYAMDGRYVPVNLTQSISRALAYPPPARFLQLDLAVKELSIHESDPNAIGSLEHEGGPFEARSWGTLKQTYTVGTLPVRAGGGFLVNRHFMSNHGVYQTNDPEGDNYVSISSSNPAVSFAIDSATMGGMHGGFRRGTSILFYRVDTGTLVEGDKVTVTYGDTSSGSRGLLMPSTSSDRYPFPIYIALDAQQHFLSLPIQHVVVTGTKTAGVHAFAPSILETDEAFEITVRAEDEFFNRAVGEIPIWSVQLAADDGDVASLNYDLREQANAPIQRIQHAPLTTPGVYRITVTSADGSIQGVGNPILVEEDPSRYIYWGDTHGHSGFAEGIGTPERFMEWAKEDARLDYVTHSEHDIWMDDYEWQVLKNNVENYSEKGRFIAFLGYEWTIQNFQGGHHNVLFRNTKGRDRVPAQTHGTLSRLYQGLREKHDSRDVVVIPHAHQPGDYRLNDPELEPLVEIMSQHGTFEWFARMYLNQGHQVGFTAASDNHLAQPGYTAPQGGSLSQRGGLGALRAMKKDRDSLFDAMRDLASYATTGDRIILDVQLNGVEMGQRAPFKEERVMTGRVIGTAPINEIAIVRNDKVVWKQNYLINTNASVSAGTYQIVFKSDSTPTHPFDNPRGWRVWSGTMKVENATLVSAKNTNFGNIAADSINRIDDATMEFAAITRGGESSVLLELEQVTASTELTFQLNEGREFGGGPPKIRRHQLIPASSVVLRFADMTEGQIYEAVEFQGYEDSISLRKVVSEGELDVSFRVELEPGTLHGDYYYVRVTQANDAIAWSSPIWVGGFNKQ